MSARARALLFVLCGSIFLEGVDISMLGVALPAIKADLGMAPGELQWVVSAYALAYGGFMLLGGRAADLLGRRKMFVFWLAVFVVFSGLGGLAGEGWMLITARAITGLAAAFMTPAGLSLITSSFAEGPLRNRALLWYAGTAAGGFSLGLVVGGLLTALGWRWVFFAPVILAVIILVMAVKLIERDEAPERVPGQKYDVFGAVTMTLGAVGLVYTVVVAPEVPVSETVLTAVISIALLVAFVIAERRSAEPLVRLGIFRSASLVRANIATVLFAGSFFGFQFIAVLYMQDLRDWTALETGVAMLVIGIDSVLAPTLTPKLVDKFGNPKVLFVGFIGALVAYALFLDIPADANYWTAMFPTMVLLGLAFTLVYGPLTIVAVEGVDDEEQGLAGGIWNTSFQFGAALGLALAASLSVAAGTAEGGLLEGFHSALMVPVIATAAAVVVVATGLFGKKPAVEPVAEPAAQPAG
ncbi:MFS transporter [Saccharothrix sp. ALI-22-I]|uniref:MFS transporter n=1 Tax=Saccharothrix sp. ALI-22-I TaxID=1933778 RepID=UPI00097C5C80|nr:MFS transporter [Saccharothrix sp. ALI-22-I]ONI84747.1 MFS transporter [Saccharothrix sp. ALI-22-I]